MQENVNEGEKRNERGTFMRKDFDKMYESVNVTLYEQIFRKFSQWPAQKM